MSKQKQYSKEDCIESLKKFSNKSDKLTHKEYVNFRSGEELPSYSVITSRFGSWNRAKEKANLPTNGQHKPKIKKPPTVSLTDNEWEKLKGTKRYNIKIKAYIAEWKVSNGCYNCGYDSNEAAMQVHHPNGRNGKSITEKGISFEQLKKELKEECLPLCGNCHNIEHNEKDYLTI
jgi:predicted HNH restriction endonuclease